MVIGDTHALNFKEMPSQMIQEIIDSEFVIHTGDYTSIKIVDRLMELKTDKFIGVHGNADRMAIRKLVPSKRIVEIEGIKIGVCHPVTGGPSSLIQSKVKSEFQDKNLDILIFGHTHEAIIEKQSDYWLLSPGKGYLEENTFGPPTSYIRLLLGGNQINPELVIIQTK